MTQITTQRTQTTESTRILAIAVGGTKGAWATQGKLVRVLRGSVLDVAVDIRKNSPTFGKSFSIELSESNKLGLWIPTGFAHGFHTLENDTLFYYDCTALYNPAAEGGILWNDRELGIDWGIENPTLSAKDAAAPRLSDCISMF